MKMKMIAALTFGFLTSCLSRNYNTESDTAATGTRPQDKVLTLMYHEIVAPNQRPSTGASWVWASGDVSLGAFRDQMSFLKEKGYNSISVQELYAAMKGTGKLPAKPVLITLDDAYLGNYQNALPVLRKFGHKAVFFIPTGTVGVKAGQPIGCGAITDRDHFTWEQAKEIDKDPLFEVENHSHCHPVNPHGMDVLSEAELDTEVRVSKEIFTKKMGREPFAFAYPQGRHNRGVVKFVAKHYKTAYAVRNTGEDIDQMYQIKRQDIGQRSENFEAFINDINRWMTETH